MLLNHHLLELMLVKEELVSIAKPFITQNEKNFFASTYEEYYTIDVLVHAGNFMPFSSLLNNCFRRIFHNDFLKQATSKVKNFLLDNHLSLNMNLLSRYSKEGSHVTFVLKCKEFSFLRKFTL